LVARERDGQLVSGHDRTVACWDALDGRLVWDYTTPEGTRIAGLQAVNGLEPVTGGTTQDYVVLAVPVVPNAHTTIARIAGDGSDARWQHVDSSTTAGSTASIAVSAEHIYYITTSHGLLTSNKANIASLDRATGKEISQTSASVDSIPLGMDGQYVAATASGFSFLISADRPFKSFKFSLLDSPKVSTVTLDGKGE
jgi:hypothetical protein